VINLVTLGKALGLSEPVVRERARRDEFAELGIRVLRLGAQYWCRQPTSCAFSVSTVRNTGPSVPGSERPPVTAVE